MFEWIALVLANYCSWVLNSPTNQCIIGLWDSICFGWFGIVSFILIGYMLPTYLESLDNEWRKTHALDARDTGGRLPPNEDITKCTLKNMRIYIERIGVIMSEYLIVLYTIRWFSLIFFALKDVMFITVFWLETISIFWWIVISYAMVEKGNKTMNK